MKPLSYSGHPSTRRARKQEKGVALVTVLAIVLLMTVLIMSFFTMATTELAAAQKDNDNMRVRTLADAAVNMVIAQIREATTSTAGTGSATRISPWSSQPGAIRVYQLWGDLQRIYKLYSSSQMAAANLKDVEKMDIQKDWNQHFDQWVDMNAPVIVPNPTNPNDLNQAEVYYPIVDPRARRTTLTDSVEGFDYNDQISGTVKAGGAGGGNNQRLPMPVRWLYLLTDGTIGHISSGGEFVASSGAGNASKENPIVGRVAFWTDDETCKINVNTASEGVFWDTPRASTGEEAALGTNQPKNGEYQRYPGHPAMVSMSSVLFPYHRWRMKGADDDPTGSPMKRMSKEEIQSIWRMAPYIYGEPGNDSTFGGEHYATDMVPKGTTPSPKSKLIGQPNPKHLYNSFDDYLFTATSDAKIDGTPKDVEVKERDPVDQDNKINIPVDRVKQARFFITTHSSGPEITLHGTPRVCLWPIDNTVKTGLEQANFTASTAKYTIFDSLIAFNASLQRKNRPQFPYYFQRQDCTSRHAEFYTNSEGRNVVLYNYVARMAEQYIPGFGPNPRSGATTYKSFGDKYGNADYDDLRSIVALMFDYIRNQNLYDGNISEPKNRYMNVTAGTNYSFGQVTPICLCGGSDPHAKTWYLATVPRPKGIGRFLTVSEVALIVTCRAYQAANAGIEGDPFFPVGSDERKPYQGIPNAEIEAGILIEGFVPAQGWGEYRPSASFQFGGNLQARLGETSTNGDIKMGTWSMQEQPLVLAGSDSQRGVASTAPDAEVPSKWIAWGGNLGVRFVNNLITFKPILIPVVSGPPVFNFSGTLSSGSDAQSAHARLIVYDTGTAPAVNGADGNVDTGNLIQCIPLAFPSIQNGSIRLPIIPGKKETAKLDNRIIAARASGTIFGPEQLIRPADIVQSLVPNHSDFRLIAAKRMVMQGQSPGKFSGVKSPQDYPTFVAHPNYGRTAHAHNLREPMPDRDRAIADTDRGALAGRAQGDSGYFEDSKIEFEPEYLPDYPIRPWGSKPIRFISGFKKNFSQGALIGGREDSATEREIFNATRYDQKSGSSFERGKADPAELAEFNTGVAMSPDGPYINRGDDGELRGYPDSPYFKEIEAKVKVADVPKVGPANFAPNRVVASAGSFGSLPTGVQSNVPWQTLLFRPDLSFLATNPKASDRHFGSIYPRDHLFMDFFWMPVVEPYAISEPFETKGKINMNYQILPFTYIKRATALHALLKAEKIMAIPDNRSKDYKLGKAKSSGEYDVKTNFFRHYIDADETLKQWEDRFADKDKSIKELGIKPGAFISASEVCDQWLVPEGHTLANLDTFWATRKLTGDNLREKPYANLYPRLTTRSNSYRVHVIAQALRKVKGTDPTKFDPARDQVTAEYRGSYLVERSIDPTDPDIEDYAELVGGGKQVENSLDRYYTYRISQVKQFAR